MKLEPSELHTCGICKRPLNQQGQPDSEDCGGDCLRCMAQVGDPDCIRAMEKLNENQNK